MRAVFLFVVLMTVLLEAQTATKKPTAKPQSECAIALKATSQAVDSMSADLAAARVENERLRKENQELTARAAEADKKFVDLRDAALPVYNYAVKLDGMVKQANSDVQTMADKYNNLLMQANNLVEQQNARLARQQRINNALAVYGAMQIHPYVLPPPPVFVNPQANIQCTSSNMGNTTYTNCH
jgi:chromosome segregation ATPase